MLDPTLRLSRERARRAQGGPAASAPVAAATHTHTPPPHRMHACPQSLPEGTTHMPFWYRRLGSPQSPSSACSTWKASDFWWPDDPSLPSMSQTGTRTRGGKATHSGPVGHRPLHPKPSTATLPSGQKRAGHPEGQQQEHPQTRGMGLAGLTEGPTVHTSKGGNTGTCKASGK